MPGIHSSSVLALLMRHRFMLLIILCLVVELRAETDSPMRALPTLFDQQGGLSMGLPPIRATHTVLYCATTDSYKFCHHANLAVFRDRLYAMWSNGVQHEDATGQRILYCSTGDGLAWSKPAVLVEAPTAPSGPRGCVASGFHVAADRLIAYYTTLFDSVVDPANAVHAVTSCDGITWSPPKRLFEGLFIQGPYSITSGRLLMAGQWANYQPRIVYTDSADGLTGWSDAKIPRVMGLGFPEPAWYLRPDKTIVMLFRRDRNPGCLKASISTDGGRSWTLPVEISFPSATARCAAGNLPDGTAFLINNPNQTGLRNPLTIALSHDGLLFDRAWTIRSGPTRMRYSGNNKVDGYQYPNAAVWKDHLYVAYSINKEDIGVSRIRLKELATPAR
jgi:hypothetical protein